MEIMIIPTKIYNFRSTNLYSRFSVFPPQHVKLLNNSVYVFYANFGRMFLLSIFRIQTLEFNLISRKIEN